MYVLYDHAIIIHVVLNRYITVGRVICKKYHSKDGQISQPERQGKFCLKTGIFRNTPPDRDIFVKLHRTYFPHF